MTGMYSNVFKTEQMEPLIGRFRRTRNIAAFVVHLKNIDHSRVVKDPDPDWL